MKRIIFFLFLTICTSTARAQVEVRKNTQHAFPKSIPAGNYSGIAWLGGDRYAVVSDKSADDGFFVFRIVTDSVNGNVTVSPKRAGKVMGVTIATFLVTAAIAAAHMLPEAPVL